MKKKDNKYYNQDISLVELSINILFIGMFIFLAFSYLLRRYFLVEYPFGDFLFYRNDLFMDFFNVNGMVANLDPYISGGSSYPPFILLIAYFFSLFSPYKEVSPMEVSMSISGRISFVLFFLSTTVIFFTICFNYFRKNGIKKIHSFFLGCLLVFNAPFMYMLDRGNYLILALIFYLLFYINYKKNNKIYILFLAIAISIKIYPALAIILLLYDKKYIEALKTILLVAIFSLFPILFFNGGFINNIIEFFKALFNFGGGYVDEFMNVYFSVGLNSFLRLPFLLFNDGNIPDNIPIGAVFIILAVLILGLFTNYLRKEDDFNKKCLIISVIITLLTPISYLYNLVYLIVPFILLVVDKKNIKVNKIYIILLSLLFIPKTYIYFSGYPSCISLDNILNPVLLILILLVYRHQYRLLNRQTKKLSYKWWC